MENDEEEDQHQAELEKFLFREVSAELGKEEQHKAGLTDLVAQLDQKDPEQAVVQAELQNNEEGIRSRLS